MNGYVTRRAHFGDVQEFDAAALALPVRLGEPSVWATRLGRLPEVGRPNRLLAMLADRDCGARSTDDQTFILEDL